jgi:hypothetical protein
LVIVMAGAMAMALGVVTAAAQGPKSATAVKEFVGLAGGEMRFVAARVPTAQDEFVGALHIPGVQLIVVWARYEEPSLLNEALRKGDYQGVYTDLNSASYAIAASKIFFEDLREDGLFPTRQADDGPFDSYESAGKRIAFDGDWRKQKLTEKDYQDAYAQADAKYATAVELLVAVLKKGS